MQQPTITISSRDHAPDGWSTPRELLRVPNAAKLRAAGRKDLAERAAHMESAGDKREMAARSACGTRDDARFAGCFIAARHRLLGVPRFEVMSGDCTLDIVPTLQEAFTLATNSKRSSFATIRIFEIRGVHPSGVKTCIYNRTNGRVIRNDTGMLAAIDYQNTRAA